MLQRGLHLITHLRSNRKNRLMLLRDKIPLRKRSLIETVFGQMKNVLQIQHTRHRSPCNGCANIIAALAAFCLSPNKPKIRLKPDENWIIDQNP
ncbi:MAG: transposase [Myxococcota bacterium]